MDACAAMVTTIEVAAYCALTAGSTGFTEYEIASPLPVGSLANVLPAALAWRSVWICAASALSTCVTCAFQLATSVALAVVTCLGSAPPEAAFVLVTAIVLPRQLGLAGHGSPFQSVTLLAATLPAAPEVWETYVAVGLNGWFWQDEPDGGGLVGPMQMIVFPAGTNVI